MVKKRGGNYEGYKDQQAEISRERSKDGRNIGRPRPVQDPARRDACEKSLKLFAKTYFPNRFPLPFCPAHDEAIERMESCIVDDDLLAMAFMRGGGKTTLAEVAVIWAVVYGYRRFVVLLQATQPLAARSLKKIQRAFETNKLLAADFPEICDPILKLERIHNRAKGQHIDGSPTLIEWTADGITLPTVEGSKASGAMIYVTGIGGAVRGLSADGPDGSVMRPDLVLVDDAQTRDSAKSPTQTNDREAIINDDVMGLSGTDRNVSVMMLCTPIFPNDLSERFLSMEKHPEWRGIRTRMLSALPTNMALWDEYADVLRESLRSGDRGRRSSSFYLENQAAMDAGAVATWPERVKAAHLTGKTAIELAMKLRITNPLGFQAEYQCEPEDRNAILGAKELNAEAVSSKLSGVPRYEVPGDASRLTGFIDVGGSVHWFALIAWDERFNGLVIDYGCWPRQNRNHFAASDARPTLAEVNLPGMNESQLVFAGLSDLTNQMIGRKYFRQAGGSEVEVDRILIDSGWNTDTVHQFCRQSPHSARLHPSKGVGRSATSVGVARWKPRPGEKSGMHWRLTAGLEGKKKSVQFDPDHWKSFVWERFLTPPGGGGCLSLFGRESSAHAMIGEHCAAEYASPVTIKGDTFDKWEVRPDRPDNHLFDVIVGATVAASVEGLLWSATGSVIEKQPPKPKIKLSELQAQKRQKAGLA